MIVGDSGQPLQLGHESERVQWLLALSRGDFASVNLKHRKWPQSKRHDSVGARGFNIGCGWLDSPMQFGVYQPSVVKPQITLGADVNTALAAQLGRDFHHWMASGRQQDGKEATSQVQQDTALFGAGVPARAKTVGAQQKVVCVR